MLLTVKFCNVKVLHDMTHASQAGRSGSCSAHDHQAATIAGQVRQGNLASMAVAYLIVLSQ